MNEASVFPAKAERPLRCDTGRKGAGLMVGSAMMVLLAALAAAPALAQDIDFGDDSSTWANNGQCDDPRFEGPGAAIFLSPVDEGRDAADCQAALEAGEVIYIGDTPTPDAPPAEQEPQDTAPGLAPSGEIDFGDDSGMFARDGECDDPRFGGNLDSHTLADATDCQEAYEADEVTYLDAPDAPATDIAIEDIDFGDDSGILALDGECDDVRFGGAYWSQNFADATDCREAFEAGEVTYSGSGEARTEEDDAAQETGYPIIIDGIDFGDDSGAYPSDNECDDPRFEGPGVWSGADEDGIGRDATDCARAWQEGTITLIEEDAGNGEDQADEPAQEIDYPIVVDGITFGDNSGGWSFDDECDDPRFGGALETHRLADASDCLAAYEAGEVTYLGDGEVEDTTYPIVLEGIDFGNDDGLYAFDDECDDPRFQGRGMGVPLESHRLADATDCSLAYLSGTITLIDGEDAGQPAPQDTGTQTGFRINFGDDSGSSPLDGVCDDPRFQGRGGALELFDVNILADATDCREAYEAGTVTYVP